MQSGTGRQPRTQFDCTANGYAKIQEFLQQHSCKSLSAELRPIIAHGVHIKSSRQPSSPRGFLRFRRHEIMRRPLNPNGFLGAFERLEHDGRSAWRRNVIPKAYADDSHKALPPQKDSTVVFRGTQKRWRKRFKRRFHQCLPLRLSIAY